MLGAWRRRLPLQDRAWDRQASPRKGKTLFNEGSIGRQVQNRQKDTDQPSHAQHVLGELTTRTAEDSDEIFEHRNLLGFNPLLNCSHFYPHPVKNIK